MHGAVLDQQVQLGEHALAVGVLAEAVVTPERRILDQLARLAARVCPGAHQQLGDARDVDASTFSGGGCGGGSDGGVDHDDSSQNGAGLRQW
ncbi:hypothetical protein QF046_001841 [Microbacterium sp. W4I4]|nr:hypothetical protein [Microbacterium sp. W4I4]